LGLYTIVKDCIASLQDMAATKQITLNNRIPNDITVFADKLMLNSVLRNLITNALKFTPRNGSIILAAKIAGDKKIEIVVTDTGIGMNPELLGKLFNNDVKINRPGTDGEPSTGLGLILCKEFIEKNGGRLWVESKESKGSAFYFTLQNPE
jgi:signal transduction histidine kinase